MDSPATATEQSPLVRVKLDGYTVRCRLSDVDWFADGASMVAEVQSELAGEVLLEARPIRGADLFVASAIGFLGVTLWERLNLPTVETAQLHCVAWWKQVGGPRSKGICSVGECNSAVHATDLCSKHYEQKRSQVRRNERKSVTLSSLLKAP